MLRVGKRPRMDWLRNSDYNRWSLAECTMYRYKTIMRWRQGPGTLPK
jgi:hypothetical protein